MIVIDIERQEILKERFEEKYFKFGMAIFLSGAGIILFYFFVKNIAGVGSALGALNTILSPFIYGLIMAYLLCPIYNFCTRNVYKINKDKWKNNHRAFIFAKTIASIVALIVLLAVMAGIMALLIPQLIKSVIAIVEILPGRLDELTKWITSTLGQSQYPRLAKYANGAINHAGDYILKWAANTFMPGSGSLVSRVSTGVIVTLRTLLNIVIGIVVSIYFLNGKERFKAQTKKIIIATFRRERADAIFDFGNFTNRTFGGFINGKIIDSIIIGIICYVAMLIMHLPYPALISTIVGVTNVIPFFGPFIGAIPSSIIICVINPLQALYFIIWIFILQQFDGNILGPKILGDSLGLPTLWIMFAIIVGGALFGVPGMVISVPIFSVLYILVRDWINALLAKKQIDIQ